jgi:sialate O-acetylesterase
MNTLDSLSMKYSYLTTVLAFLTLGSAPLSAADFRLASALSDHMVLQREKPIAVWGWADPGESVTVSFAGQSKSVIAAADGKWSLKLDAIAASAEPRALLVTGKEGRKVEVKDVVVGEVWLGSGQSNMAMTVAGCYHFDEEKAAAKFPLIRHYRESSGPAEKPQAEGKGAWQTCTPDTVGGFSAALFFFGREIHREVGVPVGLINTSVGGTPIESWVASEVQSSDPETKANYDTRLEAHFLKFDPAQAPALHQKQIAIWKKLRPRRRKPTARPSSSPRRRTRWRCGSSKVAPRVSSMARSSISCPTRCAA